MSYCTAPPSPPASALKAAPLLLLVALALQACAGAEDCDATEVGNIFTAGSCALSGGFEARVEQTRQAVHDREREILSAQRITETQLARAERMASDRAALERALTEQQYQLDRLTQQLNAASLDHADLAAEIEALQREVAQAQSDLDRVRAQANMSPEELAEWEQRIEARQQALGDALNALVVD